MQIFWRFFDPIKANSAECRPFVEATKDEGQSVERTTSTRTCTAQGGYFIIYVEDFIIATTWRGAAARQPLKDVV